MSVSGQETAVEEIACGDVAANLLTQISDVSSQWQDAEIDKWKREKVEKHFKEQCASVKVVCAPTVEQTLIGRPETLTDIAMDSGGFGGVEKEEVCTNLTTTTGDEIVCDTLSGESCLSQSLTVKREYLEVDDLDTIDPLHDENLLEEREEEDEGGDTFWNQDIIDRTGEVVTGPGAAVTSEEVVASARNAVGTEGEGAAGVEEVLVKKEGEIGEKSLRSLPPAPKWWRPGAPILCCDGWQSGDTVLRKIKKGKNVSSIILACDMQKWVALMGKGNNEGNAMWRRVWDRLGKMAAEQQVVWRGHSSIGHTVRMDFVFPEEEAAKKFLSVAGEMWRGVMKEEEVKWQSFSHTEEEVGWGEEPVLREQDIVAMTEEMLKGRNFFRYW